jgi:hypothetical protein
MAARQREIDAFLRLAIGLVGLLGAGRLAEIGIEQDDQDRRTGDEQRDIQRNALAPQREEIAFGLQHGDDSIAVADLRERSQVTFGAERDALDAGILTEEKQRLSAGQPRPQVGVSQFRMRSARTDDSTVVIGDQDEAASISRILGQGAKQKLFVVVTGPRLKAGPLGGFDR